MAIAAQCAPQPQSRQSTAFRVSEQWSNHDVPLDWKLTQMADH